MSCCLCQSGAIDQCLSLKFVSDWSHWSVSCSGGCFRPYVSLMFRSLFQSRVIGQCHVPFFIAVHSHRSMSCSILYLRSDHWSSDTSVSLLFHSLFLGGAVGHSCVPFFVSCRIVGNVSLFLFRPSVSQESSNRLLFNHLLQSK